MEEYWYGRSYQFLVSKYENIFEVSLAINFLVFHWCPWGPPANKFPGSDSRNHGSANAYLQTDSSVDLVVVDFLWAWGEKNPRENNWALRTKKRLDTEPEGKKTNPLSWENRIGWDFEQRPLDFPQPGHSLSLLDACLMPSTEQHFACLSKTKRTTQEIAFSSLKKKAIWWQISQL